MKSKSFIFDSHALLKFFQREEGHEKIIQLLENIRKQDTPKYINAINVGEMIYVIKESLATRKK